MHIQIKNDLEEMSRLRDMVIQFSEENSLSEEIVFALDLCLEELVTNIIKYAYDERGGHAIQITLLQEKDLLVLEIRDEGRLFDPTQIPEPDLDAPLEERRIGGLGIHLVRSYVTSMEYRREGNQNITILKKRIPESFPPTA